MDIICIAQWLYDNNFEFYTFPVRIHGVINIVKQNALSGKHVSIIFYRENMMSFLNYVTVTLRTLYAWVDDDAAHIVLHVLTWLHIWRILNRCYSAHSQFYPWLFLYVGNKRIEICYCTNN